MIAQSSARYMCSKSDNGSVFDALRKSVPRRPDVENKRTSAFAKALENAAGQVCMEDNLFRKAQLYVAEVKVKARGRDAEIVIGSSLEAKDTRLAPDLIEHLLRRLDNAKVGILSRYRGIIGSGPQPSLKFTYRWYEERDQHDE